MITDCCKPPKWRVVFFFFACKPFPKNTHLRLFKRRTFKIFLHKPVQSVPLADPIIWLESWQREYMCDGCILLRFRQCTLIGLRSAHEVAVRKNFIGKYNEIHEKRFVCDNVPTFSLGSFVFTFTRSFADARSSRNHSFRNGKSYVSVFSMNSRDRNCRAPLAFAFPFRSFRMMHRHRADRTRTRGRSLEKYSLLFC